MNNDMNELKNLLPSLVTGSQSATVQANHIQTQLQQPILSKLNDNDSNEKPIVVQKETNNNNNNNNNNDNNNNNNNNNVGLTNIQKTMKYNKKLFLINLICTFLVIVGGLNWGAHIFGVNLVEQISNLLNKLIAMITKTNYNIKFNVVLYSLVFTSAVILASQKSTWLPFLGPSVLPNTIVPLKTPINYNKVGTINTKPNTKVAYWSSLPNKTNDIPFVIDAYGDYSNAGVVMSDDNGVALLPILEGTNYYVPSGREIQKHIHWRLLHDNGMMGPVRTYFYN